MTRQTPSVLEVLARPSSCAILGGALLLGLSSAAVTPGKGIANEGEPAQVNAEESYSTGETTLAEDFSEFRGKLEAFMSRQGGAVQGDVDTFITSMQSDLDRMSTKLEELSTATAEEFEEQRTALQNWRESLSEEKGQYESAEDRGSAWEDFQSTVSQTYDDVSDSISRWFEN